MSVFRVDLEIENVSNLSTKEKLKEVLSCYNNGNYRATVVVLYTTVIYDLLQKLVILGSIYNDKKAIEILNHIDNDRKNNITSPKWEETLLDKITSDTELLSHVEKEELNYLKKCRNYAAHPIYTIEENVVLKEITKETAIDLIRKAFEIVFLRDPILGKNVIDLFLNEMNEYYKRLNTGGFKEFIEEKFFKRMTQKNKDLLFKTLWKLTFVLDNAECNTNREANYLAFCYLFEEDKSRYTNLLIKDENLRNKLNPETIRSFYDKKDAKEISIQDIEYYKRESRMLKLVQFFQSNPTVFDVLPDSTKKLVAESVKIMFLEDDLENYEYYTLTCKNVYLAKEQVILRARCVFLSSSIDEYLDMVSKLRSNYHCSSKNYYDIYRYCVFDAGDLQVIREQFVGAAELALFNKFLIDYCLGVTQFDYAINLFSYLKHFYKTFNEDDFYRILRKMNWNNQYYWNNELENMLIWLNGAFLDLFKKELCVLEEDKMLYSNLFKEIDYDNVTCSVVFDLIEQRAFVYDEEEFSNLLEEIIGKLMGQGHDFNNQSFEKYNYIKAVIESGRLNYLFNDPSIDSEIDLEI